MSRSNGFIRCWKQNLVYKFPSVSFREALTAVGTRNRVVCLPESSSRIKCAKTFSGPFSVSDTKNAFEFSFEIYDISVNVNKVTVFN